MGYLHTTARPFPLWASGKGEKTGLCQLALHACSGKREQGREQEQASTLSQLRPNAEAAKRAGIPLPFIPSVPSVTSETDREAVQVSSADENNS
jgi:hypothetical protein